MRPAVEPVDGARVTDSARLAPPLTLKRKPGPQWERGLVRPQAGGPAWPQPGHSRYRAYASCFAGRGPRAGAHPRPPRPPLSPNCRTALWVE